MEQENTATTQTEASPLKGLANQLICELAGSPGDIFTMMGCREFYPLAPNSFGFTHLGGVAFKYDADLTKNHSNLCRLFALPDGSRRMVWCKIHYEKVADLDIVRSIEELETADKVEPEDMEEEWWKHTSCCVRIPKILREFAKPRFKLGRSICTPAARSTFSEEEMIICLCRHLLGDWGDLCDDDRKANIAALNAKTPCRLMSVYKLDEERTMWIITEWNRSQTTILLPEDY